MSIKLELGKIKEDLNKLREERKKIKNVKFNSKTLSEKKEYKVYVYDYTITLFILLVINFIYYYILLFSFFESSIITMSIVSNVLVLLTIVIVRYINYKADKELASLYKRYDILARILGPLYIISLIFIVVYLMHIYGGISNVLNTIIQKGNEDGLYTIKLFFILLPSITLFFIFPSLIKEDEYAINVANLRRIKEILFNVIESMKIEENSTNDGILIEYKDIKDYIKEKGIFKEVQEDFLKINNTLLNNVKVVKLSKGFIDLYKDVLSNYL